MSYGIGDHVVYSSGEVCRIEGLERKSIGGGEMDYFRLVPIGSRGASYYVLREKLEERVHPVMTREQILSVIDRIPATEDVWDTDKTRRKSLYSQILKSGGRSRILGMIRGIYSEQQRRSAAGKSLAVDDERAFAAACSIVDGEFAFVLGIKEEEVGGFIHSRLVNE